MTTVTQSKIDVSFAEQATRGSFACRENLQPIFAQLFRILCRLSHGRDPGVFASGVH